jgi:hypothetical protein
VSITYPSAGSAVSGTVTVQANANDNIGVVGVQFMLDNANLSAERTTTPYSVTWNTTSLTDGSHTLKAVARDAAGNMATSSTVTVVVSNATPVPPPSSSAENLVTVYDVSHATQANRPVSIARPFRQGDIPNYVQATVNGSSVLTQTDVKNRWPDGSVKFAIVSFVIPSLPASGSATVTFSNQTTGNNTGYLTQSDMLNAAYNFDGTIQMTGSSVQTVSARQMLQDGRFRYWLQGPVVTAVILEDRTTARTYDKDFGDGSKALHPIFEAWFYPQTYQVNLGYTVENIWSSTTTSKSMRDLSYSLVLKSGNASPQAEYTQSAFNHIGRSRWHKRFWLGNDPAPVRIDHNKGYLVTTKAIPKYDTSINVSETLIASNYAAWTGAPKALNGDANGVGDYLKVLGNAGASPWLGLMNAWDTMYLLTMDDRMLEKSLGNADLAGRIPLHFREADTLAGSGKYFDKSGSGTVDTFGRVVSLNARQTVTLGQLDMDPASNCGSQYAADGIYTGTISSDNWPFYDMGRHHMPDVAYVPYLMTGQYYYLEELQMEAAYMVGYRVGCIGDSWMRQGNTGYFNDSEVRGDAWAYRTTAYAAFISPDGTPEKAYFEDKLLNNITKDEGKLGLPVSVSAKQAHWDWGKTNQMYLTGASPLGLWDSGDPDFAKGFAVKQDGSVKTGTTPWEVYFVTASMGMARDFGYPTDNLLKHQAKFMFNVLRNPAVSPYLIEVYHTAAILNATNDWIRNWADFNRYHDVPAGWCTTCDIEGYGFIALGALSYLYPYTVDGYSGAQVWSFLRSNKPGLSRYAMEGPKWAIVP